MRAVSRLSSGSNSNVEHGRLVPDVVTFDDETDRSVPRVTFATPAYVIR